MAYEIDLLNQICTTLGGSTTHKYKINALNEWCTLLGGSGGHTQNIAALNEIDTIKGGAGNHVYDIRALNSIDIEQGGTGGFVYAEFALVSIGSELNQPATIADITIDSITDTGFVVSALVTPGSSPVTPTLDFGLTTGYAGTAVEATEGEITEPTTVHFTVADLTAYNTYYFKVVAGETESADGSLFTADFADVTVIGKNKFDKTAVVAGEVSVAGALNMRADSVSSALITIPDDIKLISISGLTPYTGSDGYCAFYDAASAFISTVQMSRASADFLILKPNNAVTMRHSVKRRQTGTEVINLDTIQTEWYEKTTYAAYGTTVVNQQVDASNVPIFKLLPSSRNRFSIHRYLPGYEVVTSTGAISINATSALSEYIAIPADARFVYISGLTAYTGNARDVEFYDSAKARISSESIDQGDTTRAFAIPALAKYVILEIVCRKTGAEVIDYSTIQVEFYGETAYQAYAETLQNRLIEPVNAGLKLLVFGDSIQETAYNWHVAPPTYVEAGRQNSPLFYAGMLKIDQMRNYAAAGSRWKDEEQEDRQKASYQITTALTHFPTADIICISVGTNDGTTNLGSFATAMGKANLAALDRSLFYEAVRWGLWTLRTNYPDALIFVGNILPTATDLDSVFTDRNTALSLMAAEYDCIYVDQMTEAGITHTEEAAGHVYLVDGLHPNHAGWVLLQNYWNGKIAAQL